jgi:hypothetical protein
MSEKQEKPPVFIRTVKCAKCGREFIPAPQHVFRAEWKWYCKWTCYNHRNDTKEESAYEDNQNVPTDRT